MSELAHVIGPIPTVDFSRSTFFPLPVYVSLEQLHRAKMATDLARTIVAEAHAQHRSEMTTTIKQSRAILLLKSLKPCQAGSTSSWNDNLHEEHLYSDVYVRTWGLGKSVKGNVVIKGPSPAFEVTNKPAIALFLSQCFLSERQQPETKKQRLFDWQHGEPIIDEEQLMHGQVYVQLRKELSAEPLFSVSCNMEVQEVASHIKAVLEVYMAGNFVDGDEGDPQPFTAPRFKW